MSEWIEKLHARWCVCVGVPSLTLQECANALTHSVLSPHAYQNLSSYPFVYLLICVLLGLILILDSLSITQTFCVRLRLI